MGVSLFMQTKGNFAFWRLLCNKMYRVFSWRSSRQRDILLFALLCAPMFLPSEVRAAGLPSATLDLRSVSVADMSRVIFHEMLKVDYVLSPDVVASQSRLSISISNLPRDKILDSLASVFSSAGFSMSQRGGVYYVSKGVDSSAVQQQGRQQQGQGQQEGQQVGQGVGVEGLPVAAVGERYYTYKARFRPLAYLTKIAKFSGARVVDGDMAGDVLVFAATDAIKARLVAILASVDTPAQAVTIKAALVEYSDSKDSGFSSALSVLTSNLAAVYKAGPSLANSVTFTGGTIQAALSAISGDSRFSYLSQPMLRVMDGQTAKLTVGTDVPVRGAVIVDRAGNPVQSIEYRSSGVILSVTPHITGENINLNIDQQISNFGVTSTSNIDSPSLFKRQAVTTIDTKRGQLLVLAGLDENKETDSHSGLSFVPSWLWSSSSTKSKSQILLLIEIVNDKQAI